MTDFSCDMHTEGAVEVVAVGGDIDMAVADRLWEQLSPLLAPGAAVALDCSKVTFFDSSALRIAVQAQSRAMEAGAVFVLVAPSDPVARVLELSGVTGMFTVRASAADLAGTAPAG